jgi:hypothetical protein
VRDAQIDELAAQIEQAEGDLGRLAALTASLTVTDVDVIASRLLEIADYGVTTARQEATAQGASLPAPEMAVIRDALTVRARAVSTLLSTALSETAGRQAVQRTGGNLAPAEVATEVADHLRGLSNAYLEEQLGGALTQGMNTGRRTAMGGAPAGTRIVASALLDTNVCARCHADDGHEYDTLLAAETQFPVGGNKDCQGGLRCRCTLIAIYPEATPTVQ